MPELARMATAVEFFEKNMPNKGKQKLTHLDYMELAEDYADYVCSHEKFIDRGQLKHVERLENNIKKYGRKKAFSM